MPANLISTKNNKAGNKRVVFFSHTSNRYGGAESALLEMLKYFNDQKSISPYMILPSEGTLSDELNKIGIQYSIIKFAPWCDTRQLSQNERLGRDKIVKKTIRDMTELLKSIKPDIAVTNTIVSPWLGVLAANFNIPHVWILHEYGNIDHGLIFDYEYKEVLETINRLSGVVVVNSKSLATHIEEKIDKNKIVQIYYAIADNPLFSTKQKVKDQNIDGIFGFRCLIMGRITPSKGQLEAVYAVKLARDKGHEISLLLLGDIESDEYMTQIDEYVKVNDLSGSVTHSRYQPNPYEYIQASDVLLMCSRNEAFGRVTAEAILCGKPVIGTRSGATKEIVSDGKTGLLYEPGNIDELSEKLIYLVIHKELAKTMGLAAAKFARENFNHESSEERILKAFKNVQAVKNFPLTDKFLNAIDEIEQEKNIQEVTLLEFKRELKERIKQIQDLDQALHSAQEYLLSITNSKSWKVAKTLQKANAVTHNILNKKSED